MQQHPVQHSVQDTPLAVAVYLCGRRRGVGGVIREEKEKENVIFLKANVFKVNTVNVLAAEEEKGHHVFYFS